MSKIYLIASYFLVLVSSCQTKRVEQPLRLYIGTATPEGIFLYEWDKQTDKPRFVAQEKSVSSPSYLAWGKEGKKLYSIGVKDNMGRVYALSVAPETGRLVVLNSQSIGGNSSCHISLDRNLEFLLSASYGGGKVTSLPIAPDGRLQSAVSVQTHQGSSINQERQQAPHPHYITSSPDNRFVFAVDLGVDRIIGYRLETDGKLIPDAIAGGRVAPGYGPRHMVFHPSLDIVYVVNELVPSITLFKYLPKSGQMTEIETLSTLSPEDTSENYCAAIRISKNGKFLYASNRGNNEIALFHVQKNGTIRWVETVSTQGDWPRDFAISPDNRFLAAANRRSNNVVVFCIDSETGKIGEQIAHFDLPNPVSVLFSKSPKFSE